MKPLTPTQRRVFDFLLAFLLERHRQPTVREICRHLGVNSPNAAQGHLAALLEKGWLEAERERGINRKWWRLTGIQLRAEPVAEPITQGAEHGE